MTALTLASSLKSGDKISFNKIHYLVNEIIRKNNKIVIVLLSRNNNLFSHTFRSEELLDVNNG